MAATFPPDGTLFAEEGTVVTTTTVRVRGAVVPVRHVAAVAPQVEPPNRRRAIALVVLGALAVGAALHPELQRPFADVPGTAGVLLGVGVALVGLALLVLVRAKHTIWLTTASGQHLRALTTRDDARAERLGHALATALSWGPAPASYAQPGAGAGAAAERVVERQVVVTRCRYCQALTPVDASACATCGAGLHA